MAKTFDLTTLNLSAGTHEIIVKARASGYADSEPSNAVSYVVEAEETYTVSGFCTLKSTLSGSVTKQQVSFASYGVSFTAIKFEGGETDSLYYYGSGNEMLVVYEEGEWVDDAYRTITFDGAQEVSKAFHDWLDANDSKKHGGGSN